MGKGARNRAPARKMRRALRRTPDRYFDLVQWLRDRGYARTNKAARDLILAGKVKADSHTLGIAEVPHYDPATQQVGTLKAVAPHVPIEHRANVTVES